CSGGFAYW
nr:immunoglobulin heavy chain junction region [Mus musculus]